MVEFVFFFWFFLGFFESVVGAPVGIAGVSFTLILSLTTRTVKKLLSITRKKRKQTETNKSIIRFLCWLKVNSIALKLSTKEDTFG